MDSALLCGVPVPGVPGDCGTGVGVTAKGAWLMCSNLFGSKNTVGTAGLWRIK